MLIQIRFTLKQPLFMRVNSLDAVQTGPWQCHQAVLNGNRGLPHYETVVLRHQIIDLPDGSSGTVFNGQHAVVRLAVLQRLKHILKLLQPLGLYAVAKEANRGHLAVCPGSPWYTTRGFWTDVLAWADIRYNLGKVGIFQTLCHQISLLAAADAHNRLV